MLLSNQPPVTDCLRIARKKTPGPWTLLKYRQLQHPQVGNRIPGHRLFRGQPQLVGYVFVDFDIYSFSMPSPNVLTATQEIIAETFFFNGRLAVPLAQHVNKSNGRQVHACRLCSPTWWRRRRRR